MRYRSHRVDENQEEIFEAWRRMGVSVVDTSDVGAGFPDAILGWHGRNLLVEIKNPETRYGRKGLSSGQRRFSDDWNGDPVHVVSTIDEAIALIGAY